MEYVTWLHVEYPGSFDPSEAESRLEELVDSKSLPKGVTRVEVNTPVKVQGKIIVALCIPFRSQSKARAQKTTSDLVDLFSRETGRLVKVVVQASSNR